MKLLAHLFLFIFMLAPLTTARQATGGNMAGLDRSKKDNAKGEVSLKYLGCAGWEITDGRTVILVDPYLSRIRHALYEPPAPPGDSRRVFTDDDDITPDVAAIDARITRADYILVHHSHFDHVMDVPYIARKTGAVVVGHESVTNVMRAYGFPDNKLITVRGGEDYEFGTFSLRVVPSLHSALNNKHYFDPGVIPRDAKTPLKFRDLIEGGSLAYMVRLGGHRILTFGSMNYIEREMEGLRPDVALVGASRGRLQIHDYTGRLMRALGFPRLVIPTHWDNFFIPYEASQEPWIQHVKVFAEEVKRASPKTEVLIPKYFEAIRIGAARRNERGKP